MSADDLEREIRRSPTMNERFLLGLLDEARAGSAQVGTCGDILDWAGWTNVCTLPADHIGWHEIVGSQGPTRWGREAV
jgi:hypothetical protein